MAGVAPKPSLRSMQPRALIEGLRDIRLPDHFEAVAPSEARVPFRPRASRGVAPLLDIYRPARDASPASVLLVHGGGFLIGSRTMKPMRFLAARLVAAGVTVASVDYRLIFRGGGLDEALDDVLAAYAFFRERGPAHGLDPARVSLVGLSAGGALAMLAASCEPSVHRLACCFGVYELDRLGPPLGQLLPPLLLRTRDRAAWMKRSPLRVPQPQAPTLLLHGTADGLVPVDQAERLAAHREALGLPTKLVIYEGAPHAFFNMPSEAGEAGVRELVAHVR